MVLKGTKEIRCSVHTAGVALETFACKMYFGMSLYKQFINYKSIFNSVITRVTLVVVVSVADVECT